MQKFTFISGATGGIGKAFAVACAKKNENLFITGRSEQKLFELKEALVKDYGVNVLYFACDLTSELSRGQLLEFLDGQRVIVNKVINVAGIDIQKAFLLYTQEKARSQIRVNAEATVCLTQAFLERYDFGDKKLPKAERFKIITIASMSGASPMPYFALYSATKAMLINFYTSLHYELKGKACVTVVMPGGVPTRPDIIKDIEGQGLWGRLSAKSPQFVAEKSLKAVDKNKLKYIPGGFNKFLSFIMKLAPKRLVLAFIAKRWSKISKDAF